MTGASIGRALRENQGDGGRTVTIVFKIAGAAIFFGLIYGLWIEPFVGFFSLMPVPYLVLVWPKRSI